MMNVVSNGMQATDCMRKCGTFQNQSVGNLKVKVHFSCDGVNCSERLCYPCGMLQAEKVILKKDPHNLSGQEIKICVWEFIGKWEAAKEKRKEKNEEKEEEKAEKEKEKWVKENEKAEKEKEKWLKEKEKLEREKGKLEREKGKLEREKEKWRKEKEREERKQMGGERRRKNKKRAKKKENGGSEKERKMVAKIDELETFKRNVQTKMRKLKNIKKTSNKFSVPLERERGREKESSNKTIAVRKKYSQKSLRGANRTRDTLSKRKEKSAVKAPPAKRAKLGETMHRARREKVVETKRARPTQREDSRTEAAIKVKEFSQKWRGKYKHSEKDERVIQIDFSATGKTYRVMTNYSTLCKKGSVEYEKGAFYMGESDEIQWGRQGVFVNRVYFHIKV